VQNAVCHVEIRPLRLLPWMLGSQVAADDEDARTVFPDIIVHRRGSKDNLLVIEAKKAGSSNASDLAKVRAFMTSDEYQYRYGLLLQFITGSQPNIKFDLVSRF
jgi:hypothetical protein